MAYIEPAAAFAAGTSQAVSADWAMSGEATGFSALEWTVIALARRDRLSSLESPGPVARAFGGLFGLGRQSSLADPRLEALRRFAVHAWHKGYTLPVSEIKRFLSTGFSAAQLETLLASVSSQRARPRRKRARG
jgi:hypothetical protein